MKYNIKSCLNSISQLQCEKLSLVTLLLGTSLGSVFTIFQVLIIPDLSAIGVYGNVLHILISLIILYFVMHTKNVHRYTLFFISYLFIYVYTSAWIVLSFNHPAVLLYAIFILMLSVVLLNKKESIIFITLELIIMTIQIAIDFSRPIDNWGLAYGTLISSINVIWMTLLVLYINKNKFNQEYLKALRESEIDHLTSIHNKRSFNDSLAILFYQWQLNQEIFSVAILDINDFKQINDTYGHDVGDEVLVYTANALVQSIRNSDSLFRIGGDEFAIIFKGIGENQFRAVMERLIINISEHKSEFNFEISMSYGIASCNDQRHLSDITKLADHRMYQAKEKKNETLLFIEDLNKGIICIKQNKSIRRLSDHVVN